MHLKGVGLLYDGTSTSPSKYLDLIVTNTTLYTPWKSTEQGRKVDSVFGEISMAADTSTTFKFEFADSETGAAAEIPYEFDMCIMDTDTGVDGVLQESGEFCGTIGDYHHGKKPPESRYFYDYICDNIDAEEYVEITREECVTIKGLAEGTGPDNPRLWDDVWMTPAAQNSCADYDKCPASGTSGYCRGPGDKMCDIIKCPGQTSTKAGAGLYSSSSRLTSRLRGKPFRYTMPKFVCFTYPAGSSSFTLTYTVGGNPGAPPYYGRNFMFGGTSIEKQCADPQAASLRSSTCKDCQFEFSLDAEGPCPPPAPSSSCPIVGESILSESLPAGVKCLDVTCSAGRRRRLQSDSPTVTLTVMLEAPSAAAIESVEARLSELMSSIAAASTLLGIRVITLPVFRPDYTGRRITTTEYTGLVVGCALGGVAALALLGLGVRHALRRAQVRPAVQKRPAELEAAQQSWE